MAERMRIQCQGCFGTFLELLLYCNTVLTENEGKEEKDVEQKAVSAAGCTIVTLARTIWTTAARPLEAPCDVNDGSFVSHGLLACGLF